MVKNISMFSLLILLLLLVFIENADGDKEPILFFIYFAGYFLFILALSAKGVYLWLIRNERSNFIYSDIFYFFTPILSVFILLGIRCLFKLDILRFLGFCLFPF